MEKIAVVGPTYPYKGGISHYTSVYSNKLAKDNEVKIFSYSYYIPNFIYGSNKKSKIRPKSKVEYCINTFNPLSWIRTAKRINEFNPDKVIFQWVSPFFGLCLGTIASLLKCRNRIFLCHNVLPHEHNVLDGVLSKFAFKKADAFFVHSEEDKRKLLRFVDARIQIIQHPVYNIFYKKISQKTAREKLDVSGKVLLFFGLVRKYKGLDYLLRAWKQVEKYNTLVIAGKFVEDTQKYKNMIRELGLKNVKIIDKYIPDDEVALYFSACDAVIIPYISGSQSGVIYIAKAFKKPVITTDVGGFAEAVGKNGIVVPPKNIEKLAEGIRKVLK